MTAITRLSLAYFRSHRALTIETDGRPVALYGPNGAGKTNIVEAVSMLSPGRGLRRAMAEELIRRPEAIGWKVSALLRRRGGAAAGDMTTEVATTVAAPGQRRSVEIDGKTASQTALGALAPMVWLTPAMDRLWMEGAAERRRFLDRAALTFAPDHGDHALAYEKAMRERNRLLKEGGADPGWLTALEAQMARAGARLAQRRAETADRLTRAQARAATVFPRADIAVEGPAEARFAAALTAGRAPDDEAAAAEAALAEGFAAGRAADERAGRALTGPHRSDLSARYAEKDVEARLCSTGEQKAILISLILATARALAAETGAAPILLLDEVAAHLDAARRAALFDEICALEAQAWMTGTGAGLFEALGDRGEMREVAPE